MFIRVFLIIAIVLWALAAFPGIGAIILLDQPVQLGWLGMVCYGLSLTIEKGSARATIFTVSAFAPVRSEDIRAAKHD